MEILKPDVDIQEFFRLLSRARNRILFLDYDGTLAPFTPRRDEAVPYPGVKNILQELVDAEHTRLILISGRWTKDLIHLLGLERLPEIWGSHGWERLLPDGKYEIGEFDETALQGLAEADAWVERAVPTEQAEHKPASLAIHWRGLPAQEVELIREKIQEDLFPLVEKKGLELHEFDGGLEFRIPGRNKGHVVSSILDEAGDDAAAAYLGDDFTDEDAFSAIEGRGLSALVRKELKPTAADIWLEPPEELLDFLTRWKKHVRE